jgi:hypothetical protein
MPMSQNSFLIIIETNMLKLYNSDSNGGGVLIEYCQLRTFMSVRGFLSYSLIWTLTFVTHRLYL